MGRKFVIMLTLILAPFGVFAGDLPDPPEGFSWVVSKNKIGTFLKPEGWFLKEEYEGATKALFITKENIEEQGRFETGFSVNMVSGVGARAGIPATEYAKQFLFGFTEKFKVLKKYTVPSQNGYQAVGLRYSGDNQGITTVVNILAVAHDREDVLYLLIFEAPQEIWDAEWEKGRVLLNQFALGV